MPDGHLSAHGQANLRMMGRLLAFDVLLNNHDRLPFLWDNQGNPGNVMFRKSDASVVSIDNAPNCISHGNIAVRLSYLEKVRSATTAAFHHAIGSSFDRIRSLLCEGCPDGHGWPGLKIDIGEIGVREVQRGYIDAVSFCVESGSITQRSLEEEFRKATGQSDCSAIDADFVVDVMRVFKDVMDNR